MKSWSKRKNAGRKKGAFALKGLLGVVHEALIVTAFLEGFIDGLDKVRERSGFRPEEVTDLAPGDYEVLDSKPKLLTAPKKK